MSVTIQQAASNSIAAFLKTKLANDVVVTSQWPSPSKALPAKAVSVITAGARRDTPIERRLLKKTNVGDTQVNSVWQIAACVQPFQLDVWAHSIFELDAIMADLDIYLNYGEKGLGSGNYDVGSGLLLNVNDGWNDYDTKADFYFGNPDEMDSSEADKVKSYRAVYRGDANFMLAIPATSARQLLINFSMFLDGDTVATTYNTSDTHP